MLTGCDGASLQQMDAMHRRGTYCQSFSEGERWIETPAELALATTEPGHDTFWKYYWSSPCSLPDRGGRSMVVSVRSVYGEREWTAAPLHIDYLSCADEILVSYPTGVGRSSRLLLPREGGSEFGHRELTLMKLLRPHLEELTHDAIGASGLAATPGLTVRQVEIVRQVGHGLTNREIGRVLGIREATVRKHLEHAYLRLGVLSRTGAVTAVFGVEAAGVPAVEAAS